MDSSVILIHLRVPRTYLENLFPNSTYDQVCQIPESLGFPEVELL